MLQKEWVKQWNLNMVKVLVLACFLQRQLQLRKVIEVRLKIQAQCECQPPYQTWNLLFRMLLRRAQSWTKETILKIWRLYQIYLQKLDIQTWWTIIPKRRGSSWILVHKVSEGLDRILVNGEVIKAQLWIQYEMKVEIKVLLHRPRIMKEIMIELLKEGDMAKQRRHREEDK